MAVYLLERISLRKKKKKQKEILEGREEGWGGRERENFRKANKGREEKRKWKPLNAVLQI